MKAVLLAGGSGTRLWPCTLAVNKHLLPVHDQPVIHYPLALLMQAGCRDIALVVRPEDEAAYRGLFGTGERFGIAIEYLTQQHPRGIADAVALAEDFVAGERFCVALGDGLFLSERLPDQLRQAMSGRAGATVFACHSASPEDFAVLELDAGGRPVALREKPVRPASSLVVPGLYVYEPDAFALIRELAPSARGELEITALNERYLEQKRLAVVRLDDAPWLDLGTFERLAEAARLVREHEQRTGRKPGCPEVAARDNGWIDDADLLALGERMSGSPYGAYLCRMATMERKAAGG